MEKRVEDLEKNLSAVVSHIKDVHSAISGGLGKVDTNFEKITAHLNKIEAELLIVNSKIDSLSGNTEKGFGDVNVSLEDLKMEISKINDVTSYDHIYENLEIVK